jgi:hypothetical protein
MLNWERSEVVVVSRLWVVAIGAETLPPETAGPLRRVRPEHPPGPDGRTVAEQGQEPAPSLPGDGAARNGEMLNRLPPL